MPDLVASAFRQILLWPFQLVAADGGRPPAHAWDDLLRTGRTAWKEVDDEFTGDPHAFQARHYHEFVAFLPYVQRFLYGDEPGVHGYGESPMRVFRRGDVATMRVLLTDDGAPVTFEVAHVDLYFFSDLDIAILAVEVAAAGLPLDIVQDTLFKMGRVYPAFWEDDGKAGNCPRRVEWLDATGRTLAMSDYDARAEYLHHVCAHRAPRLAAHWAWVVGPIDAVGSPLRLRQIEYYRMPVLAYVALDRPEALTRADFVRLAFAMEAGPSDVPPYSPRYLVDFESRHCYDREWHPGNETGRRQSLRFLCCGHAFVAVGPAGSGYFTNAETGVLGQFRHELFLLGVIAHFHRAALLMLSERLTVAISGLDFQDKASVRTFRRAIRQSLEQFLRFTHRYWFHEVSDQGRARELFRMWTAQLDTDRLYSEVREEIHDMNQYLEAGSTRRQTDTVVRLTVVTTFGLIGTVATGFLGMNLIAAADEPLPAKIGYFLAVLIPAIALTVLTIAKSGRLAEFLDALSDEREPPRAKLAALRRIWASREPRRALRTAAAITTRRSIPPAPSPRPAQP